MWTAELRKVITCRVHRCLHCPSTQAVASTLLTRSRTPKRLCRRLV